MSVLNSKKLSRYTGYLGPFSHGIFLYPVAPSRTLPGYSFEFPVILTANTLRCISCARLTLVIPNAGGRRNLHVKDISSDRDLNPTPLGLFVSIGERESPNTLASQNCFILGYLTMPIVRNWRTCWTSSDQRLIRLQQTACTCYC